MYLAGQGSISALTRTWIAVCIALCGVRAYASLSGPSENYTGTFTLDWSHYYNTYELKEYKNGVHQRTLNFTNQNTYTVTGRTTGEWSYNIRGWGGSGGGSL